ncbi:hypothetical protein EDC01DRAFT_635835 [Geopyxis carbonaria]|nr:hypothetical protein EDC01DRAFT_635835 [Geopyxis carbonaria]
MAEPTKRTGLRANNATLKGVPAEAILRQMGKHKLPMSQRKQDRKTESSVFFAVAEFFSWKPVRVISNLFKTKNSKNIAINEMDCESDQQYDSGENCREDSEDEHRLAPKATDRVTILDRGIYKTQQPGA